MNNLKIFSVVVGGLSLMAADCSSKNICSTDTDCPGDKLCLESKCTGPCVSDNDCPGTYVCEASQCMNPYSTAVPQPRTAVETWEGLRGTFQNNNLEAAVQYFAPHVRDTYKYFLSHVNLPKVGAAMPTITETFSTNKFFQYGFEYEGKKYAVTMNCENETCQIIGL